MTYADLGMANQFPRHSSRPRNWLSFCQVTLLLAFAVGLQPVWAAEVTAEIDRNPLRMGETLNLTLIATEEPDGDPELSPLERDFEVLGNSYSEQTSFVNGKASHSVQWLINLAPKHEGKLTIPAISIGKQQTAPLAVTVEAAPQASASPAGDQELLLEVEATPKNPYVQAQVIYTVRLLRKVNFANADLSEPAAPDALVQRLNDGRNFAVERGGEHYAAVERKYAIFPQKSGKLHIDPVVLTAQLVSNGSGFNRFFGQPGRHVRLRSEAVDLDVRPVPAAFKGEHWLPAESLQLEQRWSPNPPHTKAGEPITRTLVLHAVGATVGVLPDVGASLFSARSTGIKSYADQPVLNEEKTPEGIASSRQEKVALISGQAGRFSTSEVSIPWWNTRTDRMEVARLPVEEVVVDTAAGEAPPVQPSSRLVEPTAEQAQPESVIERNVEMPVTAVAWWWPWVALTLAVGWTGTVATWFAFSRKPSRQRESTLGDGPVRCDTNSALKSLKSACLANDAAAARDALLDWARLRWVAAPPVNLRGIAERVDSDLATHIEGLERMVYGPKENREWRGDPLWEAVRRNDRRIENSSDPAKPELASLNRLGG